MTANMNAYWSAACPAYKIPRTISCDKMKGSALRSVAASLITVDVEEVCFFRSGVDDERGRPLPFILLACTIRALEIARCQNSQ